MTTAIQHTIELANWRPADRGSLKATFSVVANGTKIHECRLLEGQKGLFICGPQRSYEKDGQRQYVTLVEFGDGFRKRVLEMAAAKYQAEGGDVEGDEPPFMEDR